MTISERIQINFMIRMWIRASIYHEAQNDKRRWLMTCAWAIQQRKLQELLELKRQEREEKK